jgi:hypothetical protein
VRYKGGEWRGNNKGELGREGKLKHKKEGAAENAGVGEGGIRKRGLGGREREKLEHPVTCEGSIDADRPSLD